MSVTDRTDGRAVTQVRDNQARIIILEVEKLVRSLRNIAVRRAVEAITTNTQLLVIFPR
ncbi:hypothetical protein D3C73_1477790 [compost metagenome]